MAGLLGVIAAQIQILYLAREWDRLGDSRWPRPFGSKESWLGSFFIGTVPSLAPPAVLIVVWFGLLISWR